jgi:hypothetical protein
METENILMGQKQLQRWHVIKMVEGRKMTLSRRPLGYGIHDWNGE